MVVSPSVATDVQKTERLRLAILAHRETTFQVSTIIGTLPNKQAGTLFGWFGTLTALCTLGVIPLTAWLSGKIGKREIFLITISLSLVGYALKWIGYNPDHPYWLLVSCPFARS